MATFKFRARELWIYKQTEVYILQLFVRTRIDLLELKSHIIHVLKSVVNNRIKINRFFSINKRLKKIAPPFYWPASFKARLDAATLILFIALF